MKDFGNRWAGRLEMLARLRGNPELQSALVRLATCVLGGIYIGMGAWTQYYKVDLEYFLSIFLLHFVVSLALLANVLKRPEWALRRYVALCLDVIVASLAISITQEAISPFYLLYILIFISAGTRFGRGHLIVAAVVAVIAYNIVLIELDEWRRHTFEAAFFLLLLILLPWYQASLLRQVQQARSDAERANRAKGDFLAVMTHELRTPLTGVIGMTDLLEGTRLDATQRDYVKTIAHSANTLNALIGDILDFSKIEARKLVLERLQFDPHRLVHEVCEILAPQARAAGLELICRVEPQVPHQLMGDPLRVRQILFNLLGNAIKFTERGKVEVRLSRAQPHRDLDRPHLLMEVIDTGIGIAPDKLNLLFESFRQAEDSTTRRFGGTGLGTTIARELTLLMDGIIAVDSEQGRGSRFQVRLPLLDKTDPLQPDQDRASSSKPSSGPSQQPACAEESPIPTGVRVLVAEDNEIAAKVIAGFLTRMGLTLDRFSDGEAALAAALTGHYRIAIVDLHMPKLDGIGFTQRLRAQRPDLLLPIMALTANASEEQRHDCLAAGMDAFLTKPIRPDALRQAIVDLTAVT